MADLKTKRLHGLEWVRPIESAISERIDEINVLELTPENFFHGRSAAFLKLLKEKNIPVVIHGIELSLGTLEPLKKEHLEKMLEIAGEVNTVYFSEHLSMSEADGVEIGELTPLHFTQKGCDYVCRKIEKLQKQIPYPFMIENIANRFLVPQAEMKETAFINQVIQKTGCGLQLDITNLYTNSVNFKFDPMEWLKEIDLSRTEGIQLAGGTFDEDGILLDNHSVRVPEPVWDLYRHVLGNSKPNNVIVEWTDNFPPLSVILDEVRRAETESSRPVERQGQNREAIL